MIEPGICYGRLDVDCVDITIAADRLRPLLPRGIPLFSSPLRRARQLAEALAPKILVDSRLSEIDFGEWEGRRWDQIERHQLDAWAGDILGFDGCLNFFAGPTNSQFKAEFNWYNVHYLYTHVVGTSGGNTSDMKEAIEMMTSGKINPAAMITHIGGLNAVVDTVLNLPKIPGGKKLIYTQIELPLTAIADFGKLGETDPLFAKLDEITKRHNGLWSPEAEKYLLANK